ncbi:hypothetical protein Bbelb_033910 [Branchiostoma belcheri]|nr:hypothetical protein Bbelb_033910 [Branchiostoma belcheri]
MNSTAVEFIIIVMKSTAVEFNNPRSSDIARFGDESGNRDSEMGLCGKPTWHGPLSLRLLVSREEERQENGARWKEDSVVGAGRGQSFHKTGLDQTRPGDLKTKEIYQRKSHADCTIFTGEGGPVV